MFPSTTRQWVLIWVATFALFAVAGWNTWPALFQTRDERLAYLRENWAEQLAANPTAAGPLDVFVATVNRVAQADRDVTNARRLAAAAGAVAVALAAWQRRGRAARRRQPSSRA